MNPSAVTSVVRHENRSVQVEASAVETTAAETTAVDNARCIPQYVQLVEKTLRYRLNPVMADPFIAAIATVKHHQTDINIQK